MDEMNLPKKVIELMQYVGAVCVVDFIIAYLSKTVLNGVQYLKSTAKKKS